MEEMMTSVVDEEARKADIREARRQFSRLGLMFTLGTIVIYAVQIGVVVLVGFVRPQWLWNNDLSMLISILPMYLIGMPVLILLVRWLPADKVPRDRIKKVKPGSFILAAMMGFSLMYIFNIIGTFLTTFIGQLKGSPVENEIGVVAESLSLWMIFLYMVLCAPIMEEYIFRKMIIERTVHYGQGVAVVMSGLMFGLFHGNLNQFMYAFALGLFLAFLYVRTGNLKVTIAIHMMINFMGGFFSSWVTREVDLDEYMDAVYAGGDTFMNFIMQNSVGLIGLLALEFFVIIVTLAGFILLIVFLAMKKFKFASSAVTLPKGKKFSTMFLNVGMIIYCLFWIAIIIYQLLE